jgi:hypothetical protein
MCIECRAFTGSKTNSLRLLGASPPPALPLRGLESFCPPARDRPLMGPQGGQSMAPNRAGGYRPLCPALRASLFDSPGRGFAPPHRFAAVPLPNSRLSRRKIANSVPSERSLLLSVCGAWGQASHVMETPSPAESKAVGVHRMPCQKQKGPPGFNGAPCMRV